MWLSLSLLLAEVIQPAVADIQFPTIERQVQYKKVIELPVSQPDHKIAYGESEFQYGELWLPADATQQNKAPLVVFIHGGCWLNAYDIKHTYALTTAFKQAGYAVWSLEYRRAGDEGGGWPGTFDDIRDGIHHINQLGNYPVDSQQVIVTGHSAGGHLALWYGSQYRMLADTGFTIRGIVGLAPIVDLATYAVGGNSCQNATPKLMGGPPERFPSRYQAASPSQLDLFEPSIALLGDDDRIVPNNQGKTGVLPTRWLKGGGHFDFIHPGSPAWELTISTFKELLP